MLRHVLTAGRRNGLLQLRGPRSGSRLSRLRSPSLPRAPPLSASRRDSQTDEMLEHTRGRAPRGRIQTLCSVVEIGSEYFFRSFGPTFPARRSLRKRMRPVDVMDVVGSR